MDKVRLRNWCWTLTYGCCDTWVCPDIDNDPLLRYSIWSEEKSDDGYHHFQGYSEYKKPVYGSHLKRTMNANPLHLEQRMGTPKEASDYCEKEDTHINGPWKTGTFDKQQGKRNDLCDIANLLSQGEDYETVGKLYPAAYIRYFKGMMALALLFRTNVIRHVTTLTWWGGTGLGKSRKAYEDFPDIYSKPAGFWWDGYIGQETILLDDFDPDDQTYKAMLKVVDRYPLLVPVKGGFVQARWTKIIITSNDDPEEWYNRDRKSRALRDRLTNRMDSKITHWVAGVESIPLSSDRSFRPIHLDDEEVSRFSIKRRRDGTEVVGNTGPPLLSGERLVSTVSPLILSCPAPLALTNEASSAPASSAESSGYCILQDELEDDQEYSAILSYGRVLYKKI